MLHSRSSVVRWLWTNNPFYAISAVLMLYAVRASYGQLEIGAINCWVMMGILAAYTSVLAAIGVAIVRWGHVWDDARSIFLLLLVLFLAVSVSADDLFVKMQSSAAAIGLLSCGLVFSSVVFLGVLHGARIRMGLALQIPFVLFLALFYATPWWCSPELHPMFPATLDWNVFLFPQVAAALCLTLLPAVRRGQDYVKNNGTPWAWPWFPWVAFGVIGAAVIFRSYALSLTFSQTGMIWVSVDSREGIVLDTMWRPYFVAPFFLAILVLAFEAGLVSGQQRLVRRVQQATFLLVPMTMSWDTSAGARDFLTRVTETIGSPVWLALWMLIVFHAWGFARKIPRSEVCLIATGLLFSWISPTTVSFKTIHAQPWPMFIVAAVLAVVGLRRRSSVLTLSASVLVTWGLWLILPESTLANFRATVCYHVLMITCLILSILYTDRLSAVLRPLVALQIPISAFVVMTSTAAAEVALPWRLLYVTCLVAICLACARFLRSQLFWAGFVGTTMVLGYSLSLTGFRWAGTVVGRNAITAFSWSIGTLLIGALISAYKARWLPPLALSRWIAIGQTNGEILLDGNSSVSIKNGGYPAASSSTSDET